MNIKTLTLAAVTVLSLGSAAMAQEGGPSMPTVTPGAAARSIGFGQLQAGSSDVTAPHAGARATIDYSDLANPG